MKNVIESTDVYDLIHHTGMTSFSGCQCFKDCSCHEDFVSTPYDFYAVKKKINKIKTTHHSTIDEARIRIAFLVEWAKAFKKETT